MKKNNGLLEHNEQKIAVKDYVQSTFKDNRIVTVGNSNEGTFFLAVENLESSGRNTKQYMHLTEESMLGLFATMQIFFELDKYDMAKRLSQFIEEDCINYRTTISN